MFFGVLQPFNLMESAENQILPFVNLSCDSPNVSWDANQNSESQSRTRSGFPPWLSQYTCHLEHASWLKDVLHRGLQERLKRDESGEMNPCTLHVVDDIFAQQLNYRLQKVVGPILDLEISNMRQSLRHHTCFTSKVQLQSETATKSSGFEGPQLLNGGLVNVPGACTDSEKIGISMPGVREDFDRTGNMRYLRTLLLWGLVFALD